MDPEFLLLNVSDNANYGDLLFPLILTRFIKDTYPDARVTNFAPIRSDWSELGALPTQSYREFVKRYAECPNASIIVGGGGLFNTSWDQLVWRLNAHIKRAFANKQLRRVIRRLDIVRRMLSPISIHLPFVLSHRHFWDASVSYNSVGAFPMDHRRLDETDVAHLKRKNTKLTVRDHSVISSLKQFDVPVELIPDSALIMSDVFPVSTLGNEVRPEIRDFVDNSRYLCVQLGEGLGLKDIDELAEVMIRDAEDAGYELVLCPIKYRIPNRIGDEILLSKLAEKHSKLRLISPKNLFETMFLIARSGGYVGTSLHGFITAYSFGVPAFGFSNVEKLKAYIETWLDSENHLVDLDRVSELFQKLKTYDSSGVSKRCTTQKEAVYENLQKIVEFGR